MTPETEIKIPVGSNPALITMSVDDVLIEMTYDELHRHVNQLAYFLQQNHAVGEVIAVQFEQQCDYVISMLAIWKVGMVYMPVYKDKLNPEKNTAYCEARMKKAGAKFLLSTIPKPDNPTPELVYHATSPEELAYIISSSGSTGEPKMILIPHEALMSRIRDHQSRMDISLANHDCMLGMLDFAWDASIMETLSALTSGIPLFVVPTHLRESITTSLKKIFSNPKFTITTAIFVPSVLAHYQPDDLPGLVKLLSTGEAFENITMVSTLLARGIRLFNGWGPTETTFGGSIIEITESSEFHPIFKNTAENNGLFTGLTALRLVKNTASGKWKQAEDSEDAQIFIVGKGLGRYQSYVSSSFISRDHFDATFEPSVINGYHLLDYEQIYDTHDVVRTMGENSIFSHRSDDMVKRGGKQIFLSAIEQALKKHFEQVIVIAYKGLIRAFIYHKDTIDRALLKEANVYYQITDTRLFNQAGKMTRRFDRLNHVSKRLDLSDARVPYTDTESMVVNLWESLLGETNLNLPVTTDFTEELGADSLMVMQMISCVWKRYIISTEQSEPTTEFSRYIFRNKTIQKIAQLISCCNHSYLKQRDCEGYIYFELDAGADLTPGSPAMVSIVSEIRRIQPVGPYILLSQHACSPRDDFYTVKTDAELRDKIELAKWARTRDKLKKTMSSELNRPLQSAFSQTQALPGNCLVVGDALSGKTELLISLLQQFWETDEILPLYISLQGKSRDAIRHWLQFDAGLTSAEIKLVLSKKLLFLLDDYDLINRYDYPEIDNPGNAHQMIIASRNRYRLDLHFEGFTKICLGRETPLDLSKFIVHEKKRLKNPSLTIRYNPVRAGQVIDLGLKASRWEHGIVSDSFSGTEKELLVWENDCFKYPSLQLNEAHCVEVQQSVSGVDCTLQETQDVLVVVREGFQSKPIFAFAPITGDIPDQYRKLSDALGHQQPFYIFKLSRSGSDRTDDLDRRATYYGQILHQKYPSGNIILLGWSFGAVQAFAVAKFLISIGRTVDRVINIDSDWPTLPPTFQVEEKFSSMRPKLEAIYASDTREKKTEIYANVCLNLEAYKKFTQTQHYLNTKMSIFKASDNDTGLCKSPTFKWPCMTEEPEVIVASTHFDLLYKPDFVRKIKKLVDDLQPRVDPRPLSERLDVYKKKRLADRVPLQGHQPLHVRPVNQGNQGSLYDMLVDGKVNVLCGEPGAGKTSSLLALEMELLNSPSVPVFVSLKQIGGQFEDILYRLGLTPQEIDERQKGNYLFLLDGFDEVSDSIQSANLLHILRHYGTICVSVRTYVYDEMSHKKLNYFGEHQRLDLQPLSDEQIKNYLDNAEDYDFVLNSPELNKLAHNPLSLSLIKKILPELRNVIDINRNVIYTLFFNKLFEERKHYLETEMGINPRVDIKLAFEKYNRALSLMQWNLATFDLTQDIDTLQASRCAVVTQHETFVEYFLANVIFDELMTNQYLYLKSINFAVKLSFLDFVCEKIQALTESSYLQLIHQLMISLHTHPEVAANIATLLNKLEISFSGLSLQNVNLAGANLTGAIFDRTRADRSDFTDATLVNAYFSGSSMIGGNLLGTNFGEYPEVTYDSHITSFAIRKIDDRLTYAIAIGSEIQLIDYDERDILCRWDILGADPISDLLMTKQGGPVYLKQKKDVYFRTEKIFSSNKKITQITLSEDEDNLVFYTSREAYGYNFQTGLVKQLAHYQVKMGFSYEAFCINATFSKIAYIVHEEGEHRKCRVYSLLDNQLLYEHKFPDFIKQICFFRNTDYLCILVNGYEFVIVDIFSNRELYALNLDDRIEAMSLGSNLDMLCLSSYSYSFDWDMGHYPSHSTFQFHTLPVLGYPVANKKLKYEYSKLHPSLPLMIHCIDRKFIEVQSLMTKQISKRLQPDFEILRFDCFDDYVFILGPQELQRWNVVTNTIEQPRFFRHRFSDRTMTYGPTMIFNTLECYAIYDAENLIYINQETVIIKSMLGIEWVKFLDTEKLLIGWGQYLPQQTDDGDYTEIVLHTLEWFPLMQNTAHPLRIDSDPCSIEESPLYEYLDANKETYFLVGGGRRRIYACESSVFTEIGSLPGYGILKIKPNLIVCSRQDEVCFYQLYPDVKKLYSFPQVKCRKGFAMDEHETYLDFEWNDVHNILYVSNSHEFSLWHINLQPNAFTATLIYDYRARLEIRDLDYTSANLEHANSRLLTQYLGAPSYSTSMSQACFSYLLYRASGFSLPQGVISMILAYLSDQNCSPLLEAQSHIRTRFRDIPFLEPLIKNYFLQLCINSMSTLPDNDKPIEVTASNKMAPYSLTVGFFRRGKPESFELPSKIIINPSVFFV